MACVPCSSTASKHKLEPCLLTVLLCVFSLKLRLMKRCIAQPSSYVASPPCTHVTDWVAPRDHVFSALGQNNCEYRMVKPHTPSRHIIHATTTNVCDGDYLPVPRALHNWRQCRTLGRGGGQSPLPPRLPPFKVELLRFRFFSQRSYA